MTNYPEGVSGNESAIAGSLKSKTISIYEACGSCETEQEHEMDVDYYGDGAEVGEWDCVLCGYTNYWERYPEFEWNGS
jgi:hypothetical protein